MTKNQVMQKVRSMMGETRKLILQEAEHLLSSGMVDYAAEQNNFRVPKLILSVAMHRAAQTWEPLSWNKEDIRLLKNLEKV